MSQLGLGMTTVTQEPRRSGRRGSGRRGSGVAVLIAAGVVLGLVAVVVIVFLRLFSSSTPDYTGSGHGEVVVVILIGDNLDQIGQILQSADVVKSSSTFVAAASADPNGQDIQPGSYKMHAQMSAAAALALLLDPTSRISKKAVIPEGLRMDETVRLLARATGISVAAFDAVLAHPSKLGLPLYARGNPEGFLFPATYDVQPGNTALGVLSAMVTRFGVSATRVDIVHRAAAVHLTPYQVVILASLVQAEGTPADFSKIARTILNRLAIGMKLQLNSTVNYVMRNGKAKLSLTDIAVQSPYNTYLVTGLPPGPINSPGEAALAAVLSPAAGNWIYFVTVNPKTGETKFTNSYAQFLTFKAELTANGG
jgi:UPF0755 protein